MERNVSRFTWFLFVLLVIVTRSIVCQEETFVKCDACFAQCADGGHEDPSFCECRNATCEGTYCFAKIELFPDQSVASIQKGCSTDALGGRQGCYFAGTDLSIECYCDQPYCARVAPLNGFAVKELPKVECCECTADDDQDCTKNTCGNTCMGEYCVADLERNERLCGMGQPRILQMLHADQTHSTKEPLCVRTEVAHRRSVVGCTCATDDGRCNDETLLKPLFSIVDASGSQVPREQRKVFCYSLSAVRPNADIDSSVFESADTCEGHYCFIELTTVSLGLYEITDDDEMLRAQPELNSRFELQAGCMSVSEVSAVSVGCSSEYADKDGLPQRKHCVCRAHMCNYYYQLTKESSQSLRSIIDPKDEASFGNPRRVFAKDRYRDKDARIWTPPTRPPYPSSRSTAKGSEVVSAVTEAASVPETTIRPLSVEYYDADQSQQIINNGKPQRELFIEGIDPSPDTFDQPQIDKLPEIVITSSNNRLQPCTLNFVSLVLMVSWLL